MSESGSFSAFMKKQGISITFDRICIKALGAMAHGLFASLLIGTIIKTLGQNVPALGFMVDYGNYASSVTGAAMAVSIGYALQSPPLRSLFPFGSWRGGQCPGRRRRSSGRFLYRLDCDLCR